MKGSSSFYLDHRDAALYLLQELADGLEASYRIRYNDAFEYVILLIYPPPEIAFFGVEYFVTIRMEQDSLRLGYTDDENQLQAAFFPDLVLLRERLQDFKPDLHAIIHRWEHDLEDWRNEPDEP